MDHQKMKTIVTILALIAIFGKASQAREQSWGFPSQRFAECDFDYNAGVSWTDIQECEAKIPYCKTVPTACPSKRDFDNADENEDGKLNMSKYSDLGFMEPM